MSAGSATRAALVLADVCVGDVGAGRYVVGEGHCVRHAGEGEVWRRKPRVMASVELIRMAEEVCMRRLHQEIPPTHCVLGTSQQLHHHAPVSIGAVIEVTARCERVDGHRSRWQVAVSEADHVVATGTLSFVVTDLASYEQRRLADRADRLDCDPAARRPVGSC